MSLPKLNLAALKGGPAMIYLGPSIIYTKTGVDIDASGQWEDLLIDGYDVVDKRKKGQPFTIKFTPSGVWDAGHLLTLCGLVNLPLGSFITPRFPNITADHTTGQITVTAHGRQSGESGYVAVTGAGVLPDGLTSSTLYYLHVVDANTLTLHATQAAAIAGTSAETFTDNGTAPFALIINNPLIIQSYTGDVVTFWNAAIDGVPDMLFTASGKTIFGEATAQAFLRHGYAPGDGSEYFTTGTNAFDPTTFPTLSTILTQPYSAAWGTDSPWAAIQTQDGFKLKFSAKTEDKMVDGLGIVTKQLMGATAECSFLPTDADIGDLLTALQAQGVSLGASLQALSNDLIIQGTGVYAALYNAGLTKAPAKYNMKDRRAGEVTFTATRKVVSGALDPLLYLGTAAP